MGRSRCFWLAAVGPVLILTACAVGPDYHAPLAPVARQFFNASAPSAAEGVDATRVNERWWRGFNDPLLTRLVEQALDENFDIAQGQARVLQARAQAQAAGAALLPAAQLQTSAAASRQSLENAVGRIERQFPGFNRNGSLFDLNAAAAWDIDLFGGQRRAQQAAAALYQASGAAEAAVRLEVATETADAYLLARSFQARITVAEDQVTAQEQLLALVELQFDRGVASRQQRDQAASAVQSVKSALPLLRAGLESQIGRLDVLTGGSVNNLRGALSAEGPIPQAPPIDASGGPASLIRRRPDIVVAERRLAAADADVGAALSEYYPKISLSALAGFESLAASNLVSASSGQQQGLAGLRWRLFDFGRVDAQLASAKGGRALALAAYRSQVLQAGAEVETALSNLSERRLQLAALSEGEASESRATNAATAAFAAGHASQVDALAARQRLLGARDQRLSAETETVRAALAAVKALGGGWTAERG